MYPMLGSMLTREVEMDARRAGERARRLADLDAARHREGISAHVDIAIREAEATDVRALVRLAELDTRPIPAGRVLVAAAAGEIRAALSVDTRELIADPFAATTQLEELLRLRADQISSGGRRHRLLGALHMRPGRAA
jgi:hypothetical protein